MDGRSKQIISPKKTYKWPTKTHMRCYSYHSSLEKYRVTNTVRCQNAREGVEKKESSYIVGRNIGDIVIMEKYRDALKIQESTTCMHSQSLQSCPTIHDPTYCSMPGSTLSMGFSQRSLEWVVMPSSGEFPNSRIESVTPASPVLQGILYC